ncbi:MAG: phosphoribosylglycinamide formyltransferase [Methanosarcina thermophila]|jgi:phosphoribosylglycinamide formyltransferase-1|uniref:phosphoribosylglycinamide formyltransferase 1 n=3 Tax=Methanosarcina thermophila TaxID=2210 RepID=A0A1I6XUA1_METTE|nr:phosphoribosylglycinamide formyltransferase [Methanosarcina thermophila]ALK05707.1 MAG: phosphoribosylglycinamide formyltransferase [Methanosarcina sp. 795]AKB12839.1 Phosphoribosylglycinamide formyltransferase [Methanosarcina thermophila TM-1]AKB16540.1 Phosphoribosylglycinamide formyltransferase [Methanosarcina thermophila CHTI-55]NLU56861.1 phosphoribosylglycinamide formyltransferase [Methanosarcina thermophila]SFT41667.1 formyltetrahydrofolate-dependent phosphoribosylglycinamide formylt
MTVKIAVLVSGRGSNLQAIIDSIEKGYIKNAEINVVISNKANAYALERARIHGISTVFLDPEKYDRDEYDKAILNILNQYDTDLLLLAGYFRILGNEIIEAYRNRIMNIHPSLLPAFKGLHAQRQAFEYGVKVAGCTVHFVDEGLDSGPIILQKCVPVIPGDTEETLTNRILEQEHIIYPEAVKLFTEGKLKIEGRNVVILD